MEWSKNEFCREIERMMEMLEVTKNITLNGVSKIDGQAVAYMSANISTDGAGSSNVNKSISNKDLYDMNKTQVRKDMAEFEEKVYQLEDELVGGNTNEVK